MSSFFESVFAKYQCGFRKGFSAQQCLLAMLERQKRTVDKGKVFGVLLTDLFKPFDCLNCKNLMAKLGAYGFSLLALKLIYNCLLHIDNKEQRLAYFVVIVWKQYQEFLRDQYQGRFYSISFQPIFMKETEIVSYLSIMFGRTVQSLAIKWI